jgi:DNA polymerase V
MEIPRCLHQDYTVYMSSSSVLAVVSTALAAACSDVPVRLPADGLKLNAFVVGCVAAGFPSPAEVVGGRRIDLIERLITHPQATYVMRVRGLSMVEAGIFDGDVVVVDRAIKPRSGQIVVAIVDGEFTVKYLWMRAGRLKLKAANPTFPDIVPREGQVIEVWGVVKAALKEFQV